MSKTRLAALLLSGFACAKVGAVELQFDHTFQSDAERAAVFGWAEHALELLPPTVRDRLPERLRIRFRSWGRNHERLSIPVCVDAASGANVVNGRVYETYGRFQRLTNVITLNVLLLPEIAAGPLRAQRFDCYHGDFYHAATATLLHEIAHAYDTLNVDVAVGKSERRSHGSRTTVSSDPAWRTVAGFNSQSLGFITGKNRDLNRLPAPRAAANPAESFATHFEYFLLDTEYRCRFPTHYEYLNRHFSWSPPASDCKLSHEVVAGLGTHFADLNPDRVYQLRYLLASPGQETESKFGHSMLHIVTCAPDTPPGPVCLEQEEEHLVLGFVALSNRSPWRIVNGVVGVYDSAIVVRSLQNQLKTYNDIQMRDVMSYGLQLSRVQIRRVLLRALEMYWTYRGPYRFLTNNCATEMEDLLEAGILDERYSHGRSRTPRGVLERLVETDFVNDEETPLLYESQFQMVKEAVARTYEKNIRQRRSLTRWIGNLSYEKRQHAFDELRTELESLRESLQTDSAPEATMMRLIELGSRLESFRLLESEVASMQETRLDTYRRRERRRLARVDEDRAERLGRLAYLAEAIVSGDRDETTGYGIPVVGDARLDLVALRREFDAVYRDVSAWDGTSTNVDAEANLDRTWHLAAQRHDALRAYADLIGNARLALIRNALSESPEKTNSGIRAILETQFGAGSFESVRVSDVRFDEIRQEATVRAYQNAPVEDL